MNEVEISNQDAPPALREALDAAYTTRDTARANAELAAAALTRAQRVKADADERVRQLTKSFESAEAEQAYMLAAQITLGTDAFPANPSPESIAVPLQAAKAQASITEKALASIQDVHTQRQTELAAAESAVAVAVDAILDEDLNQAAKLVEHHLYEAARIGKALYFEVRAIEVATHHPIPEPARRAVERIDMPLINRDHIPINILNYGDFAAIERRKARRAEMISGESSPVADAAA